jgi:SAM-dependent methyltransferase
MTLLDDPKGGTSQPAATGAQEDATVGWKEQDSLRLRPYRQYREYLDHQASKLKTLNLGGYHARFKKVLAERLQVIEGVRKGASVLCLGARSGAECEAFIACGCFALGIDLNPGERSRFVVIGDFHGLQYADASVDIVYTNALDHAFDFGRIIGEVARVLKPSGLFIAEIVRGLGDENGRGPGAYESAWWNSLEAPISRISKQGFELNHRSRFEFPWQGDTCVFAKTVS